METLEQLNDPFLMAGAIFVAGLLPLVLSTCTAFVKIAVVLAILRNALGLQQTPPNIVLNAGAMVLTIYVMYPVLLTIQNQLAQLGDAGSDIEMVVAALPVVFGEMRNFMLPLIQPEQLEFFMRTASKIWPSEVMATVQPEDFLIVLPAFFLSELQSAIELGVIIFIPFLIIDLLIATVLMALGMIMVPPTMIALPIKLMFFVGVSGWSLIADRLLSSYASGG